MTPRQSESEKKRFSRDSSVLGRETDIPARDTQDDAQARSERHVDAVYFRMEHTCSGAGPRRSERRTRPSRIQHRCALRETVRRLVGDERFASVAKLMHRHRFVVRGFPTSRGRGDHRCGWHTSSVLEDHGKPLQERAPHERSEAAEEHIRGNSSSGGGPSNSGAGAGGLAAS